MLSHLDTAYLFSIILLLFSMWKCFAYFLRLIPGNVVYLDAIVDDLKFKFKISFKISHLKFHFLFIDI